MDTVGDPSITFESDGTCNYCNYALARMNSVYFPNEEGQRKLQETIDRLKTDGRNRKYDCVMGISGGLDSAYLAYLGSTKWGLRILGVHIDDGFDSPIAAQNIHNLSKYCNFELVTVTPNKEQFMDLTRSFFFAGVPGICIPQDNVLIAELFHIADTHQIKYFLSGTNFALESILQRGNMHNASDIVHIKSIHKKFGNLPIDKLPLLSLFDRYIKYKYFKGQCYIRPLDWIEYIKERAISELADVGFDYYEGKHYESILTRFLQVYYMPKKFNIDIRKSHISSLIISGQITRDQALLEMQKPLYDESKMESDIKFILENLKISRNEFNEIMAATPKQHSDYESSWLTKYNHVAIKYRRFLSD